MYTPRRNVALDDYVKMSEALDHAAQILATETYDSDSFDEITWSMFEHIHSQILWVKRVLYKSHAMRKAAENDEEMSHMSTE